MTARDLVGRTPWSARVPVDPHVPAASAQPAGGPAADRGVRPTLGRPA